MAKIMKYIPKYGRFDDIFVLMDTPCEQKMLSMAKKQLDADIADMQCGKPISLLAKWLPSVNTSSPDKRELAKKICHAWGMSEKKYRKMLAKLRSYIDVLEKRLCAMDYTFDYAVQPAKAMLQYRSAFMRNDGTRYLAYLEKVAEGKVKMNTGTLYPYEIIRNFLTDDTHTEEEIRALDVTWNALPEIKNQTNSIAVVDGSGSMYWSQGSILPAHVALSLGMYFAEKCQGHFHNHFITFSYNPRLIEIQGQNIAEKLDYCMSFDECSNTDLEKVFRLILDTAVQNHLPQSEMPENIYVISDMEFDTQCDNSTTLFRSMKKLYAENGYQLPTIIYWNVNCRNLQFPVTMNESGAVLVSGCSPSIFDMAVSGEYVTPYMMMRQVLDSERYCDIAVA